MEIEYLPEKNPQGAGLPGVPLRDLTPAEFAAYPAWLQRSVLAAPFYRPRQAPALTAIEGIGERTAAALGTAGIGDLADLVAADPADLGHVAKPERIAAWQRQAAELLAPADEDEEMNDG